jgi:hypothetical protein
LKGWDEQVKKWLLKDMKTITKNDSSPIGIRKRGKNKKENAP